MTYIDINYYEAVDCFVETGRALNAAEKADASCNTIQALEEEHEWAKAELESAKKARLAQNFC